MRLFHGGKAEEHDESSYGTTGLEVSGMGCVKAADQFIPMDEGKWRKIGVFFQERKGDVGKIIERRRAAVHDTPRLGSS